MRFLIFVFFLVMSVDSWAVTIEFPKEELARESVLPIFENTLAVKSRLVPTKNRFELGFSSGFAMNEPFFKPLRYGGHIAYHFTETHGFLIEAQLYQKGLNKNGENLRNTNLITKERRDNPLYPYEDHIRMDYAPQPEYHFLVNYQLTAYYGKISILKNFVTNLSLYGLFGAGMLSVGGENLPAFNFGFGQKFYFNKFMGVRLDLGFLLYQGVNYFEGKDNEPSPLIDSDDPKYNFRFEESFKKPSEFESDLILDTRLTLALIFLI